jgi:PQQ-like domain
MTRDMRVATLMLLAILLVARSAEAQTTPVSPSNAVRPADAQFPGAGVARHMATAAADSFTAHPTIDRMTTNDFLYTYTPGSDFATMGKPLAYFLNDGSSWGSGQGNHFQATTSLDHVTVSGDTIRYFMGQPSDLYAHQEFDNGSHFAGGSLSCAGPMTLVAIRGSATAVMSGLAMIKSNDLTWYGDPQFNYYSSIAGSIIPYQLVYQNRSGVWTDTTFNQSFQYTLTGTIDFADPISVPALASLSIRGSSYIPDQSSVQYHAIALYANGVEKEVTAATVWRLDSSSPATLQVGKVTIPSLASPSYLTLHAAYTENGIQTEAQRSITSTPGLVSAPAGTWSMFQADARHTGYQNVVLNPSAFSTRWVKTLSTSLGLNPVTAADGKVFASLIVYHNAVPSLFALDAMTGNVLWSKAFPTAFSVNPPSYGYGNVYVQTLETNNALLQAYDAASGAAAFQSHFSAQFDRYYAPTIAGRSIYVNGGYYDGMYGFDALSGDQLWFQTGLAQWGQWTPAVDDTSAYAYLGYDSLIPAEMSSINRVTGAITYQVRDPAWQFNAPSMYMSPVLGAHAELLAIANNRLIAVDLKSRAIGWQLQRAFQGQPSVAKGVIYAIDGGKLVALDEVSHADLWSWQPPSGSLSGTIIVTNGHVLVPSSSTTYVVDLLTHQNVQTVAAGGQLALSEGVLYIASPQGVLTAVNVADQPTPALLSVFDAEPASDGIQLRWGFAAGASVRAVALERAPTSVGPWAALNEPRNNLDGNTVVEDRTVESGKQYWYRLLTTMADGSMTSYGPVFAMAGGVSGPTRLTRVTPNPSRGQTLVSFVVNGADPVRVRVFDISGRVVATLANGVLPSGAYVRAWNSQSSAHQGIYFIRVESRAGLTQTRVAIVR